MMRSNLIVLAMLGLVAVPGIMKVSNFSMIGRSVAVTTYHNDNTRQGLNAKETTLTLGNVNSRQFGKIFSQRVDGFIYAQPLYLPNVSIPGKGIHSVVYVATQHDSVYAFDAGSKTGSNPQPLWHKSLIDPSTGISTVLSEDVNCKDIYPEIGITGTPVIDAVTGTLYVVTKEKHQSRTFVQRLHALDVSTGAEKFGGPIQIEGTVPGSGAGSVGGRIAFDGLRNNLLLSNGYIYIGWASHCDNGPYHGWVMAYDVHTLKQKAVWSATANGGLGGVWQAGGAPAADANGHVLLASRHVTVDAGIGGVVFGASPVKFAPPAQG